MPLPDMVLRRGRASPIEGRSEARKLVLSYLQLIVFIITRDGGVITVFVSLYDD